MSFSKTGKSPVLSVVKEKKDVKASISCPSADKAVDPKDTKKVSK